MNYKNAQTFLNSKITDDFDIEVIRCFSENIVKVLICELKNKKEIKGKICDTLSNHNEEIKYDIHNKNVIYKKKNLLKELSSCKKRYKILNVIINLRVGHINVLLIDNKKKSIERFDTKDENANKLSKFTEILLKDLNLSNYNFINPSSYIFNFERRDCIICVPLSLLYLYLRIRYELMLDDIIRLLKSYSNKELINISIWFINYLKDTN